MELITYPFSMMVGALFVLLMILPWVILAYYGLQSWSGFITDGKHKIHWGIDRFISDTKDEWAIGVIVFSGLICILLLLFCLGHWDKAPADATYLQSLIRIMFEYPVVISANLAPVLIPLAVLFGSSFGLRKLFRVGSSVSERLKKVEDSS